jgi:tripartite-type tricarboxylate transporter receptor subunit TctC
MLSLLRTLRVACVLMLCLAAASPVLAETYPNRNITLVLPFAAGSGTDTTTRLISQHLSQALGVGIVIENKAGANGMIARPMSHAPRLTATRCSSPPTQRILPIRTCSKACPTTR